MKHFKILILLFIALFSFVVVGCDKTPPKPDPNVGDKDKLYKDSEIPTPNTDKLTLTENYEGKEFIKDGIGLVKLVQHVDGDTTIFQSGTERITVRYLGIDTPESTYKVEPWGFAASNFVKKVLEKAADNNKPIVLQADPNKGRVDSTGKRYLAWVWVDGRLLNMEVVEKCYSATKAAGTLYDTQMIQASIDAETFGTRIWNNTLKDPDYDYSKTGVYMTIKEIHEKYNNPEAIAAQLDIGKKVRVQGVVSRVMSLGSAYIQQRVDGHWYIGTTNTNIVATDGSSEMPYIGENGNWFVEETDLGIKATGEIGKTAYQIYLDNLEEGTTPLSQVAWARSVITSVPKDCVTPYIVQEDKWYGVYVYGGFDEITNFREGREVYTEANIGYYSGSLQLTGASNSSVKIISLFEELTPKQISSTDFKNKNYDILGLLVEISNLTFTGGYNSSDKDDNAFTVTTKAADGTRIDIRFQKTVYIEDEHGNRINDYNYFNGKTFTNVKGIVSIYNDYFQILLNSLDDLTY